jgi:molybdate transport system substrate-binding protein
MRINRTACAAIGLALLGIPLRAPGAHAAEITLLCSNGIKTVVEELVPQFEKTTGHTVAISFNLAAVLKRQIEAGEPFDLAILTPAMVDDLIKQGRVAADTRTTIARTGLAIMIRSGARRPNIRTADAFKRALLDAKSIAYAREGASGVFFADLIQRLGVADALKAKSTLTATGEEVGQRVARGDVELGVLPVSEILPVKGVELLGAFPADIQSYIVMVAGVSAATRHEAAAKDFIAFLTAPVALPVIKAKGMER